MSVTQSFAHRLKHLREKEGLNQSQLADKLGVSRGSISYYENCERVPDIAFLDKVSTYFNVNLNYLLGYSNNIRTEYSDVTWMTGLSDEAIDILEFFEKHGDKRCVDCINHLLLQEELSPITKVNSGFDDTPNNTRLTEQEVQDLLQEINRKQKIFKETPRNPILIKIWDYIRIVKAEEDAEDILYIGLDGKVQDYLRYMPEKSRYQNVFSSESSTLMETMLGDKPDTNIKKFTSSQILEQVLLSDIVKRLGQLRDNYADKHTKQDKKDHGNS